LIISFWSTSSFVGFLFLVTITTFLLVVVSYVLFPFTFSLPNKTYSIIQAEFTFITKSDLLCHTMQ
jgi:hypothetical protein